MTTEFGHSRKHLHPEGDQGKLADFCYYPSGWQRTMFAGVARHCVGS
jgi:hypothetical protein